MLEYDCGVLLVVAKKVLTRNFCSSEEKSYAYTYKTNVFLSNLRNTC